MNTNDTGGVGISKEEQTYSNLKLASAIGETVLGIPVLGWMIVLSLAWLPLGIMFVLHIITLVSATKLEDGKKAGSIVGIVCSVLAWIPVVWLLLHIASAIVLWLEYGKSRKA